jgi:Cof subfamily protein (haloacid dehalogenase superfamily)
VTSVLPAGVLPGGRFDDWTPHVSRLAVCDVDGTLVGPHVLASGEVVDAVGRAQAAGLRVGVATGRMRDAVEPLIDQLGAQGPHVLHNGAEVRTEDTTIAAWTLDEGQIDALLGLAHARDDTYVEIYTETGGFVVSEWDERARPHWQLLEHEPAGVLDRAADLLGAEVMKATFAAFDLDAVDEIVGLVEQLGLGVGVAGSPRAPGMTFINVTRAETDKGRALVRAARYLDVGLEAVAAIGDAENDLSMLQVAGTAIAMGQADAAIRAAAHLVVPAVDDHGVAVALDAVARWNDARV